MTPTGGARDDEVEEAVRAMGHAGRRAMLAMARDGERTATELAKAAGLSPAAASPHLKLLRQTGLLRVRVDAQRRLYRVDFTRLAQVRAVLDEIWGDALERLQTVAEHDETIDRRRGRPARRTGTDG
ncbi:metalloregulator ArsR/SmtB family transcription factor [Micromonospora sp. WMMD1128]|uniref:ArsR/SmtB family transcription factor n=1 Tax=unclassified Micromonospora TaxID=2617518 RepID=UPI00248C9DA2|nr:MULTISPECIES: metalloregulator ArsR/SmtB family transcription factor [unclassified Micromonospora]WBB73024.1 metalloregulator ArsR/SmtB family transcription factor [Micromonospora sp. WMMD1128]WFE33527.1 metalloregulator ArsR/SmtB family transcription factor [Micromonospora sp. WMMD975]